MKCQFDLPKKVRDNGVRYVMYATSNEIFDGERMIGWGGGGGAA